MRKKKEKEREDFGNKQNLHRNIKHEIDQMQERRAFIKDMN